MEPRSSTLRLDNRGLSPPEPMMRILAALEDLAEDGMLVAKMDREPIFLFAELHDRGYSYTCNPDDSGGYLLEVFRP